jgi:hypothetical protein
MIGPESARFHARDLSHGLSAVVQRVSTIRSEHLGQIACRTLDELVPAVRTSAYTVLAREQDPAFVAGLDVGEQVGDRGRVRAGDGPGVWMEADVIDQTAWLEEPPSRLGRRGCGRCSVRSPS